MYSSYYRSGYTVIEALAALGLLATLLVLILAGVSAEARKFDQSKMRLKAIDLTDQLLDKWTHSGGIPTTATGIFSEQNDLAWKTTISSRKYRANLGLDVVRLVVQSSKASTSDKPLVDMEVFVPAPVADL